MSQYSFKDIENLISLIFLKILLCLPGLCRKTSRFLKIFARNFANTDGLNNKKACYSVLWGHFSPRKKTFRAGHSPLEKKLSFSEDSKTFEDIGRPRGIRRFRITLLENILCSGSQEKNFQKKFGPLGPPWYLFVLPTFPCKIKTTINNNLQLCREYSRQGISESPN